MKILKSALCLGLACLFANSASAFVISTPFKTTHYAVNQVMLGENEDFSPTLQRQIEKSIKTQDTGKFQTTTIVFPAGSNGLAGKINEKAAAVIYYADYEGQGNGEFRVIKDNCYAAQAGISISAEQLKAIIDNRTINVLLQELPSLPLLFSDIPVSMVSRDFQKNLYYTSKNRAYLIDLRVLDSLYYTPRQLGNVRADCKISFLGIADRAVHTELPYFLSLHGTINDIKCFIKGEEEEKPQKKRKK